MDEDMDEKELIKDLGLMLQSTNPNFWWFTNHFEEITEEDLKLAGKYMKFREEKILNK